MVSNQININSDKSMDVIVSWEARDINARIRSGGMFCRTCLSASWSWSDNW